MNEDAREGRHHWTTTVLVPLKNVTMERVDHQGKHQADEKARGRSKGCAARRRNKNGGRQAGVFSSAHTGKREQRDASWDDLEPCKCFFGALGKKSKNAFVFGLGWRPGEKAAPPAPKKKQAMCVDPQNQHKVGCERNDKLCVVVVVERSRGCVRVCVLLMIGRGMCVCP